MRILCVLSLCCLAIQSVFAAESNLVLTVDGATYSNCTFGAATPATVKVFHSSGIASLPLAKLSPELQKRFGYDPQKATDWKKREQKAAADWQAQQERKETEAYINEHMYTVKYMKAAFNTMPYGKDIIVSGYAAQMSVDSGVRNATRFLISDDDRSFFHDAMCVTDGEAFKILINKKRHQKFTFIGQKQRVAGDDRFVVGKVVEESGTRNEDGN